MSGILHSICSALGPLITTLVIVLASPAQLVMNMIIAIVVQFILALIIQVVQGILNESWMTSNLFIEFTFIDEIQSKMIIIGASILILIIIFQGLKSMANYMGFESEEPWKIMLRGMFFFFLLINSKEVCTFMLDIFANMVNVINKVNANRTVSSMVENKDIGAWVMTMINNMVLGGVKAFCDLLLGFKLLGLAYNFIERKIVGVFLIMISPLAFACGASKATKGYLQGWMKSFLGTMFVQMSQYIMFLALCIYASSNEESITGSSLMDMVRKIIYVFAMTGVLDKVEDIVKELGLGVGASLGPPGSFSSMMNSAGQMGYSMQSIGGMFGGKGASNPQGGPSGGGGGGK